jgi:uncharacterized PurR-regulated membrane protein YhhQ (DUF165 family)
MTDPGSGTRRLIVVAAGAAFVATVYLANWLIQRYGPIRVWPTDLVAPAGVYVVGLAFLLRDTIQRLAGQLLALLLIGVGTGLTAIFVDARLAGASAAAFAASEVIGLAVFLAAGGNRGGPPVLAVAVVVASAVAAAVDSALFLWIAFGDLAFFKGQFVAKLSVVVLALPFVLLARRAAPTPLPA